MAICTYYLEKCGTSEIIDVVANHQFALIRREGKWEIIESSERKRAEEMEKQNIKDLKYLSETAMGFMELPPEVDIYLHIAENLKKIVGDSIIIVNSFDPKTDLTCARAVVGLGKLSKLAFKILGRKPVGMSYKINEVARHHLLSGKYHKVPGKMYELSFGQMPKPICHAIEKLFGIREIYSMGFTWRGELYGNVVIILRGQTELKNIKMIETFINQAAVALQRKQAEVQIKQRLEFEKTISNISSRFVGGLGFDEAINASLADLGKMSAASRTYLFLFREGITLMDNTYEWCAEGVSSQINNLKNLPCDMFPWWMEKLRNGEDIHLEDVSKMPTDAKAEQEILESQGIKSLLVLPLNIKGKLMGFMGFDNVHRTGEWGEIDLVLLRTSSEIIGNALERRQAEEALRISEEHFRLAFEEAPNGIAIVGIDNRLLKVNKAFSDMLGYTGEELAKLTFIDITHPEDIQKDVQFAEKLFKGDIPRYKLEKRYITKDKKIVWVDLTATVVHDQNGKPLYGLGMVEDITERRLAEKEMKRRMMKFDMEDGSLYLVEEQAPGLSIEAFSDLLKVGYHGHIISRTPRRNFKVDIGAYYDFRWISEKGGEDALSPKPKDIEAWLEGLSRRTAILIERLDYLVSKNGFKRTLTFVHRLRDLAYLKDHVIILSADSTTLSEKELRLLEKETMEVKPQIKKMIPEDLFEILRFVNEYNLTGVKPTYTKIGDELGISKPTVRKRIRQLTNAGYVVDATKGRSKIVEMTEKGRSLFLR
jgi:PAS domain S-box-containing protein